MRLRIFCLYAVAAVVLLELDMLLSFVALLMVASFELVLQKLEEQAEQAALLMDDIDIDREG